MHAAPDRDETGSPRYRLAAAVLAFVVGVPSSVGAGVVRVCGPDPVANTADVLCTAPSGPCDASTVVLSDHIEVVTTFGCEFDLGGRALRVEGRFETVDDIEVTNAASVTITPAGVLQARGDFKEGPDVFDGGGFVSFDVDGPLHHAGTLDVTGEPGGDVEILAHEIVFATGSEVRANGISPIFEEGERVGDGGTVSIATSPGRVVLAGRVDARGQSSGSGGTVEIQSDFDVAVEGPADVSGGSFDGGFFEIVADGAIRIRAPINVRARVGFGTGGAIFLEAERIHVDDGTLDLRGSSADEDGGEGGELFAVAFEAVRFGPNTVVRADAATNFSGSGGTILLEAFASPGDVIVEGSLSARGGNLGGDGGFVEVLAGGRAVFGGPVDVSGHGGGEVTVEAEGGIVTTGALHAAATGRQRIGGRVRLVAAGPANVGVTVAGDIVATSGPDAPFTEEVNLAGCGIRVAPAVRIDVRGGAPPQATPAIEFFSGGPIDLGSRSRFLAGSSGVIALRRPATAALTVGEGVVFAPPPTHLPRASCAPSVCGNGIRELGEQCDDGGTADGDGCSAVCALQCPVAPALGCRTPVVPGAARLALSNRPQEGRDRLGWKWTRGEATSLLDLADPLHDDAYLLCLYDESGTPTLIHAAAAPAGGLCDGKPCWRRSNEGFAYRDKAGTPDGLTALKLKAGAAGRATASAKSKGSLLALPPLPLTLPVRVQLITAHGSCAEAVYSTARRNDGRRFKARSD